MLLNDLNLSIPKANPPLYWDPRKAMDINLNAVDTWIGYYADRMPEQYKVDEASILVPNSWHRLAVAENLREAGWEKFNYAKDVVYTNPFGTRYCVEYSFYRHPSVAYRIEVMMPSQDDQDVPGFSPLHTALLWPDGVMDHGAGMTRYPVPHLSFKVPDRKAYSLAVRDLQDKACIHAMTCQSGYGHFGYYLGNDAGRQVYIKPRHNMRDAA